jgi:hypothetical protein
MMPPPAAVLPSLKKTPNSSSSSLPDDLFQKRLLTQLKDPVVAAALAHAVSGAVAPTEICPASPEEDASGEGLSERTLDVVDSDVSFQFFGHCVPCFAALSPGVLRATAALPERDRNYAEPFHDDGEADCPLFFYYHYRVGGLGGCSPTWVNIPPWNIVWILACTPLLDFVHPTAFVP